MYPEKVAVVDGERRYLRELAERSWRLANALRSAGLRKGDRVATLLFNSAPMLEAHFGVPAAGGVLVAINNRLASPEIGYILEHSGARVPAARRRARPLVAPLELAGVTVIRCRGIGEQYEQFLAAASPARCRDSWLEDEEETISINYTSGHDRAAEGGAVHIPRRVSECAERGDRRRAEPRVGVPVDAADVPLQRLVLPVGGDRGRGNARGDARRGPGVVWQLIDDEGVTHYNGAPTVQLMVIDHPRAHRLERPVTAMVAASPPSPTLLARMAS